MHAGKWLMSLAAISVPMVALPASAQISDDVVKIGVLNDQSGQFSDENGKGSVVAANMAVADFGGTVRGKRIEIISADHQNKPDVGAAVIRRWFDTEQVDAVADLPVSSIALAAQEIARERKKTLLISGGATSDLTGKACSPVSTQWADDSYALAVGTARAAVQSGGDSWFFLTSDYAFGHAMERDASRVATESGAKVLGAVRHPLGTADFSSFLLQAQSSRAKIVGLANVGGDTMNAIKQAAEFGLVAGGQNLAAFLIFLSDIHSLGLPVAQGLLVSEGFYWDQNDVSRAWSKRFFEKHGKMPTKEQASTYAAIVHYLKAIQATGTDEAVAVNEAMRKLPVEYFGKLASIRPDGRVVYDLTLFKVKAPAESRYPWDYYTPIRTIPAEQAFRPLGEGGCSLVPR